MKIEIQKVNGKSKILLDGKEIQVGCMGFSIESNGAGSAMVTMKFITKDLDFAAEVDDPIAKAPKVSRSLLDRR